MENLEIINNVQNVVVSTEKLEDGTVRVIVSERRNIPVSEFDLGDTVRIGGVEYIMLDRSEEDCLLITKDAVRWMGIGNVPIYTKGMIHDWLTCHFAGDFAKHVGEENIVERELDMMADDGTGKEHVQMVKFSLLSADEYRRYRELLEPISANWWLATSISDIQKSGRYVYGYVMGNGIINWASYDNKFGVRPAVRIKLTAPVNI